MDDGRVENGCIVRAIIEDYEIFRPAEKYKVEMPKIQSEVQNDPSRIPIL
jgi:hypothetical protein